ncbi:decarboxylase family protein [mine drainage metagenome]|uniref:Decarboxylase family protein n=1 Tax=mine drainage metagenome TaxID=410659 RepID=T1AN03_9ZZZZ
MPLPNVVPKPVSEDPDAPRRLAAILKSPTYREACRDTDFLSHPDTRGMRLLLDYVKTESCLQKQNIEATIVVFGSTRLREPAVARAHLEAAQSALNKSREDGALQHRVAIAERLFQKSGYYDVAREFARLVSESQARIRSHRLWIMTGGGPGIMEAANRGSFDAGAGSIGLNITLPHEQYPNPYITPELCFLFHYFATRKLHFLQRAQALVAFPGGYGTFDELFETLTLIQTRVMPPVPVILVGQAYWRQAVNIDFLVAEGVIDPEDRELFWFAETAPEIWAGIQQWHRLNGTPLSTS